MIGMLKDFPDQYSDEQQNTWGEQTTTQTQTLNTVGRKWILYYLNNIKISSGISFTPLTFWQLPAPNAWYRHLWLAGPNRWGLELI